MSRNKVKNILGDLVTTELLNKIEQMGYFTKPASINHHGNEEGGLFNHSFNVAEILNKLTDQNNLHWEREESPLIVGLFHDLCKLDDYIWVVDEEPVEYFGGSRRGGSGHWAYNPEQFIKGHGDKSVMIASTLIQLTEEEMYCIRFHMGAFTDKAEWTYYTQAIHRFPNVLWAHQADMMAAHIKELG